MLRQKICRHVAVGRQGSFLRILLSIAEVESHRSYCTHARYSQATDYERRVELATSKHKLAVVYYSRSVVTSQLSRGHASAGRVRVRLSSPVGFAPYYRTVESRS